jgi:hypothetical protein
MSHSDIIARIGTAEIAAKLDVPAAHVRVWKNRRIPRAMYAELIAAFPEVTLGLLKAGEPGSHGPAPVVDDAPTMAAGTACGADNRNENITRTGEAA